MRHGIHLFPLEILEVLSDMAVRLNNLYMDVYFLCQTGLLRAVLTREIPLHPSAGNREASVKSQIKRSQAESGRAGTHKTEIPVHSGQACKQHMNTTWSQFPLSSLAA